MANTKRYSLSFGRKARYKSPKSSFPAAVTDALVCSLLDQVSAKDIIEYRKKMNFTQAQFSQHLGISLRVLKSWEQGQHKPSAPARSLLRMTFATTSNENSVTDTHRHLASAES
jgi:DNA-binding transcriptional regulator YiaG